METNGRVAVVTGGASGIGRGMARAFAGAGHAGRGRRPRRGHARRRRSPSCAAAAPRPSASVCDVSQLESVEALAAAAVDRFGAVHVLCNNAGIGIPTPTHNIRLEDWRWIIDVDLWGRSTA